MALDHGGELFRRINLHAADELANQRRRAIQKTHDIVVTAPSQRFEQLKPGLAGAVNRHGIRVRLLARQRDPGPLEQPRRQMTARIDEAGSNEPVQNDHRPRHTRDASQQDQQRPEKDR